MPPFAVVEWTVGELLIAFDAAEAREDQRYGFAAAMTAAIAQSLGAKVDADDLLGPGFATRRALRQQAEAERERERAVKERRG